MKLLTKLLFEIAEVVKLKELSVNFPLVRVRVLAVVEAPRVTPPELLIVKVPDPKEEGNSEPVVTPVLPV